MILDFPRPPLSAPQYLGILEHGFHDVGHAAPGVV